MVVLVKTSCFRRKGVVFEPGGSIRAKWLYPGKSGCIRAKWLYSGKGKGGIIQVKMEMVQNVVFGQMCLYSGKSGCIRAKWLYLGKTGCVRIRAKRLWLYSEQSGCI